MFSQVKPKLFSGNGCCDSGQERMTPSVSICCSVLFSSFQASDVKRVLLMAEYENVHKDDNQSIVILNILFQSIKQLSYCNLQVLEVSCRDLLLSTVSGENAMLRIRRLRLVCAGE